MDTKELIEKLTEQGQLDKLSEVLSSVAEADKAVAKQQWQKGLLEVQKAVSYISKDASNGQTKSRYATLNKLDEALRPHYTGHGFALSFSTDPTELENVVRVTATLSHERGYEKTYVADIPCDGLGAKGNRVMTTTHAVGSAMTYGRRYLLCMIFNIMTGDMPDDDGNAAGGKGIASDKISDEQLQVLIDLCDASGTDKAKLCNWLTQQYKHPINGLAELPAVAFDKVKTVLEKKAEKAEK